MVPQSWTKCSCVQQSVDRPSSSDIPVQLIQFPVQLCKECFYKAFEAEVHETIMLYKLFKPGEVVALGASGGKDSTVLAHVMRILNDRHECASLC